MPRTPERPGWWRFPAPSVLVFILLIGALPWVEIGCEGKPDEFKKLNESSPIPGQKSSRTIGSDGKVVAKTQNGYQAIWGGYSFGPEIREVQKEAEKQAEDFAKGMGGKVDKSAKKEKDPNESPAAPMVVIYFLLVLGAIGVGFAMPPGHWRSIVLLSTLGLATLIFVIQLAVGLPMKTQGDDELSGKSSKSGGQGAGGIDFSKQNNSGIKPYCRYTIWFHLNWAFLLIPLGLAGAEEVMGLMAGGGKKKKRRRYDEDDDEDEEDDRPRRKGRARDEDDEDEPPRKKSRARDEDDEDEDDRPRRKSRARDEDEDDEDEGIQRRRR